MRQEALADMFNQIAGAFFLVMLILSSIGLMVGGVGVVAIMMISVTERTREIGVRKALGATRREILWQFLVESMTVTVIGGIIGIAVGGGGALLLGALTPIPAAVPLWSIAAGLGVSAITGIGFGLYPANRAARLDPVEALRYE
jgi:putative ABC transport system permease protein